MLVAGNQISKSSTQIRKCIEWACNKKLWPSLWATEPKIFWYFYPSDAVATTEIVKKWIPEFLPRDDMKGHEWYGWNVESSGGFISAIHFNSGVSVYFKTYGQRMTVLQTATVHAIFGDEEMPVDLVNELVARLFATGGYFHNVFTATLGQEFWYRAMECIGTPEETYPQAFKQSVSMYDCQVYDDGSPGAWPLEKIREREAMCTSEAERLRRIMGRFVKEEGRRFENFVASRVVKEAEPIPSYWRIATGVDVGSGKTKLHEKRSSAGIILLAYSPDGRRCRVIDSFRGDGIQTTSADIVAYYRDKVGKRVVNEAGYDSASAEFGIVVQRAGLLMRPVDKDRKKWYGILGLLIQSALLTIDNGVGHNAKLVTELLSIPDGEKNRQYQDDLTDALVYAISMVVWDIPFITNEAAKYSGSLRFEERVVSAPVKEEWPELPDPSWTRDKYYAWELAYRRGLIGPKQDESIRAFDDEISAWNEAYGS